VQPNRCRRHPCRGDRFRTAVRILSASGFLSECRPGTALRQGRRGGGNPAQGQPLAGDIPGGVRPGPEASLGGGSVAKEEPLSPAGEDECLLGNTLGGDLGGALRPPSPLFRRQGGAESAPGFQNGRGTGRNPLPGRASQGDRPLVDGPRRKARRKLAIASLGGDVSSAYLQPVGARHPGKRDVGGAPRGGRSEALLPSGPPERQGTALPYGGIQGGFYPRPLPGVLRC